MSWVQRRDNDSIQLTEDFVSAENTHWLSTLAQRAGLGDASGAGLTSTTPIFEAWQTVANSLGISQADIARGIAGALHLQVADLGSADPAALTFLPQGPASTYGVLPLRATDRELSVATSNPLDFDAEREIGFLSSRRTVFEIAPPEALSPALKEAYRRAADAKEALDREEAASDSAAEATTPVAATAEAVATEAAAAEVATEAPEPEEITETEIIRAEPFDQATTTELILEEPSEQEAAETESVAPEMELILEEAPEQETSDTELITEEPFEHEEYEIDVTAPVKGESLEIAPDSGPGGFIRSLLRTLLGFVHRLRALIGLRTESSVSSEPEAETTAVSSFKRFLVKFGGKAPEPEAPPGTDLQPEESPSEGHILIVDDDEGERLLIRTILTTQGFEVSEADDGSPALSLLREEEGIDAILLDLQMKEMDGLETLEEIRKSKKTRSLPVVILTASSDPEKERELLNAGADDYLRKPVDPLQLIARIKAVIKRAQL